MPFDIDVEPVTLEDKGKLLIIVASQSEEVIKAWDIKVTCPCGKKVGIILAYRCLYCGVYFCTSCAVRHFGKKDNEEKGT